MAQTAAKLACNQTQPFVGISGRRLLQAVPLVARTTALFSVLVQLHDLIHYSGVQKVSRQFHVTVAKRVQSL